MTNSSPVQSAKVESVDTDVAQAVKPELVLHPTAADTGSGEQVTYDFALDPA